MKATKIKYEKTFNLGNYSNEVIGVEIELADWLFCVSTELKQMKIETPDYIFVVAGCRCDDKVKQIEY